MKLSSDREYLVLENQRLVHYLVQKIGVTKNFSEYEDLVSIGTVGLVKAAITFDPSKKVTFATYASKCINNEIFGYYRKANKYANDISIDEPIGNDGEGNEITVGDKIEHSESNFVKKIIDEESFIQLISIVLNYLKGRNRIIMLYRIGGISQMDIAKMQKVTRACISRIQSRAILKIKEAVSKPIYYKEVFFMAIIGDSYRISFLSKDISNFNKIFATLLQKFTSASTLPDFKVSCNKERIIIQVPAHPDSFAFIAQIIQEIEEYSMTFVSDKSILAADNTDSQKVRAEDTDKSNNSVEEKNPDMISSVVNETESSIGEKRRHTSQSKQIKEYIFTLDKFSVKQVESKFPNVPVAIVNNVIRLAKTKGLITCIAEGEYVVNKT